MCTAAMGEGVVCVGCTKTFAGEGPEGCREGRDRADRTSVLEQDLGVALGKKN